MQQLTIGVPARTNAVGHWEAPTTSVQLRLPADHTSRGCGRAVASPLRRQVCLPVAALRGERPWWRGLRSNTAVTFPRTRCFLLLQE